MDTLIGIGASQQMSRAAIANWFSRHLELENDAIRQLVDAVYDQLPEEPKTVKQVWLIQLVQRVGVKRTCIALANKTVRTAWAMLRYESPYEQQLLIKT